jgi:rhamnose transport system permease protein
MATATTTGPAPAARSYPPYARPLWQRWLFTREAGIIALLVVVYLWAYNQVPNFSGPLTLQFLLLDAAPILIIALPMTAVIVTGEIDLSVASVMGLASVVLGDLHSHGMSVPEAGLIALVAGLACGLLNGFLVAYVGLPSLAVTIGTLALYRGIAVGILGTKAVTDWPLTWTNLSTKIIPGTSLPVIIIPIAVLAVIFALLLHFSRFGRGIFDIGLNTEAARFAGVDVARTKLMLFALTGVLSAFAGLYFTLRFSSARGDNATGLELNVIAAVLLGGVSIFGGRGALHGVIGGVLLIGVVSSALRLENVTDNVINIIIGALLVLSVISTSVLAWAGGVRHQWARRRANAAPQQHRPTSA